MGQQGCLGTRRLLKQTPRVVLKSNEGEKKKTDGEFFFWFSSPTFDVREQDSWGGGLWKLRGEGKKLPGWRECHPRCSSAGLSFHEDIQTEQRRQINNEFGSGVIGT